MDEYTLFLDESYTYEQNGRKPAFAIGGFIVKNDEIPKINSGIDIIKLNIWNDVPDSQSVILHELDLKQAISSRKPRNTLKPEYVRFRDNRNLAQHLYNKISKLIKDSQIYTIGCVIKSDDYYDNFSKSEIANEISLVCMQIILENYTHFLFKNKAVGKIVYESRDTFDKIMLMRFYQVSSIGTMYVRPDAIQQRILQFAFTHKSENSQCLQLADFMPNQMARKKSGKSIYKNVRTLTNAILSKSYDGMSGNTDRFGIKIIPRIISNIS